MPFIEVEVLSYQNKWSNEGLSGQGQKNIGLFSHVSF